MLREPFDVGLRRQDLEFLVLERAQVLRRIFAARSTSGQIESSSEALLAEAVADLEHDGDRSGGATVAYVRPGQVRIM